MKKYYSLILSLAVMIIVLNFPPRISAASVTDTKFGMFYTLWHCPVAHSNPIYDTTEILAGNQTTWVTIPGMQYWGKPELGYYCLSDATSETVLRQHAQQLINLGVDFIFVDSTNNRYIGDSNPDGMLSKTMIMDPFDKLLQVWSSIPNAPKIAVWVPVTTGIAQDQMMVYWLLGELAKYPNLQFQYQGKPLLLVVDSVGRGGAFDVDESKVATLSNNYTVRKTWAFYENTPTNPWPLDHWTYMQRCSNWQSFLSNKGQQDCNQLPAYNSTYNNSNSPEEIAVVPAYQYDWASNTTTSTPKFNGLTLQKQFKTAFNYPGIPLIMMSDWNAFIVQRMCLDQYGNPTWHDCATDQWPNGNKIFGDDYNIDYNRDIEPAENDQSQIYYNVTKACIALYKSGGKCDSTNTSNLCCTVPTFIHGWVNDSQCVAVPGHNWNISGAATDDRDHTKKLNIRAEIYPDNEPYNKISLTSVANLGPIDGLEAMCPDKSCAYGFNIPSIPSSFKDKKLRVHVFGVASDTEMELNMIKVPNNVFGPCNNLIAPVPGDLDGDTHVNDTDFRLFKPEFGKTGTGLKADFDGSGKVDIFDYNILVGKFGQ